MAWPAIHYLTEGLPLLADLQHDLAASVPGRDLRQRIAGLVQCQYRRDLGTEGAVIDQPVERLEPLPGDAGGERLAGDAALQLGGRTVKDDEDRPAAVADRGDGLVAGLTAGAVQQQVDAAGNRGAHLPGPVGCVVVEHLAGAQAS